MTPQVMVYLRLQLWLPVLLCLLVTQEGLARRAGAPFPTLTVSGSSYHIGKKHGRVLRSQVRRNVKFYLGILAEKGMNRTDALREAGRFAPVLKRHTPHLLREMEGIAKGSGCTRAEILLLNARTELITIAEQRAGLKPGPSTMTPGCTSVALVNDRGRLALGQNWDWRAAATRGTVMLRIKQRDRPEVVTLTEAGMVGKIGCNSARVGVCLNFLRNNDHVVDRPGVPVHVLLRTAMESRSIKEATSRIAALPRSASVNFLIAQQTRKGPKAIDLETSPLRIAAFGLGKRKYLAHTNHFLHTMMRGGCPRQNDATSLDRQQAATRLAGKFGGTAVDPVRGAMRILSDRSRKTPISRTAADRQTPTESVTVSSVVMDLSAGKRVPMHVSRGAPHEAPYVRCVGPRGR